MRGSGADRAIGGCDKPGEYSVIHVAAGLPFGPMCFDCLTNLIVKNMPTGEPMIIVRTDLAQPLPSLDAIRQSLHAS